jgi:hypothetical protein
MVETNKFLGRLITSSATYTANFFMSYYSSERITKNKCSYWQYYCGQRLKDLRPLTRIQDNQYIVRKCGRFWDEALSRATAIVWGQSGLEM